MLCRPVTAEDIPAICAIPSTREELFYAFPAAQEFPLTPTTLEAAIAARSDSTVVEIAGRVAGFANFDKWGSQGCTMGNLMVDADYRRAGVAAFLIRHMVGVAYRQHGAQLLALSCFNHNTAGLYLYHSLGFRLTGMEPRQDHRQQPAMLLNFLLDNRAAVV